MPQNCTDHVPSFEEVAAWHTRICDKSMSMNQGFVYFFNWRIYGEAYLVEYAKPVGYPVCFLMHKSSGAIRVKA